jgi:hypothetical protein
MAKAKIKKVAAAEVRAAKKFLERKGFKASEIPPRLFAMAAKELDKSFHETLSILAATQTGGMV